MSDPRRTETLKTTAAGAGRFIADRFRRGHRYGLVLTLAFVAIALALWAFLELVEGTMSESDLLALDAAVQSIVSRVLTPTLTSYLIFITHLGGIPGTAVGVAIVGAWLLHRRHRWSAFGLVFATAGGGLVVTGLKAFFERARPTHTVIDVSGYAYPSGHAFGATVFFGYVVYLAFKHVRSTFLRITVTCAAITLALLIGTSRVFLNVHWMTDVLGGFIGGFAWLVLSIVIVHQIEWSPTNAGSPDGLPPNA